ncbi:unnamed protein product, partial [Vitis vinifera]
MISWNDLYVVLTAVIPLYVAMILAYGSVRWWKIFSPDQCSGINRFVAIFAVPLLSFHFISQNNPYAMNFRSSPRLPHPLFPSRWTQTSFPSTVGTFFRQTPKSAMTASFT